MMRRNKLPRAGRKDEHINLSIRQKPAPADFSGISLVHNCLPERDLDEVTLRNSLLGMTLRSPLFINAVTGGTPLAADVNRQLAEVAAACGLAMALGSQMAALEKPAASTTFQVVREVNPRGIVWANLGSYATTDMAERAVEMVDADALQIHLNVPQELVMGEGDNRFRGALNRIKDISNKVKVPVIIKEVGFGIAREQALLLMDAGVSAIDVGGRGGTNFMAIENYRSRKKISSGLLDWGTPTATSIIEVMDAVQGKIPVFASGGMITSLNIAKSLALGARAAGMAGLPLYILRKRGRSALISKIKALEKELRLIMLMTGAANLEELRQVPLVITGNTAFWLDQRGIDTKKFARRKRRASS